MKKIISFEKKLTFPSMIGEITTIDLEHTLQFIDSSTINGDFIITGKYKMTEASRLEENFSYNIPAEILLTEKLDLNTTKLEIVDFYYEIENEDTMICYIEIKIEGVEKIEIEESLEIIEEPIIKNIIPKEEPKIEEAKIEENNEVRECDSDINKEIEIPVKKQSQEESKEIIPSLFASLKETEETYKTYSIYILRQEETINTILEKYKTTKEELEKYNDLSNLTIGSKIIISQSNE